MGEFPATGCRGPQPCGRPRGPAGRGSPGFSDWSEVCVEHLLHCGHLDERLSRVMSMAFCSQALHQRSVGVQLGEVVWLRFGLGFWFPFFRLAGHSSSWASSLAGLVPLRVAPHFMSCSGRSPASPQGQDVVVAQHLFVLGKDLPGRLQGLFIFGPDSPEIAGLGRFLITGRATTGVSDGDVPLAPWAGPSAWS